MVDFNKPLQTRGGLPVVILKTNLKGLFSVVGYFTTNEGHEVVTLWTKNGGYSVDDVMSTADLVNTPVEITTYINFYKGGNPGANNHTVAEAIKAGKGNALARVKITYTEGQFDD